MLNSDESEIGVAFGQSESLTRRLNRLLQDYADGVPVPKELIQNADDAGATEVIFIYDERRNSDCLTNLIADGMSECQGPALWVYNNAIFSDQDFEDIARISSSQKAEKPDLIGGLGLGFNAVYNLTDVPSFLSREYLVIFDPHKFHLGKSLPDRSQPGLKINFQKNNEVVRKFRNQFQPYDGICQCNIMCWPEKAAHFNGTLFRLPLRTPSQAARSEISSTSYDKKEMIKLFEMLANACRTVLLFTQNVLSVSALHIPDDGDPREPRMLFKVTKRLVKVIRKLEEPFPLSKVACSLSENDQELVRNANILKAAAHAKSNCSSNGQRQNPPVSSMVLNICYEENFKSFDELSLPLMGDSTDMWLVVFCMGKDEALKCAKEHPRLFSPTGGVAAQVSYTDGDSRIHPLKLLGGRSGLGGKIFCYLPLPILSQLPVHINGAFAVNSTRRCLISSSSGEDKKNIFADWNECLLRDAVAQAYVFLLEDLKQLQTEASATPETGTPTKMFPPYHHLWPIAERASPDCKALISSFYCKLAYNAAVKSNGAEALQLLSDGSQWVSLSQSFILDDDITSTQEVADAARSALKEFLSEEGQSDSGAVVDMPLEIRKGFSLANCDDVIKKQTYGIVKFFWTIRSIITRLPSNVRDILVLFALDSAVDNKKLKKFLKMEQCIPVSPCGKILKRVDQLVNPKSRLACLYSPEEGRFPFDDKMSYINDRRLLVLIELGMLNEHLRGKELLACSYKSLSLYDPLDEQAHAKACQRASTLLTLIEEQLGGKEHTLHKIKGDLCKAKFLPCMSFKSPHSCKWKDSDREFKLLSPSDLYLSKHECLLCYVEPLLDEASLSTRGLKRAVDFLEISRQVPLDAVLRQLLYVTENIDELLNNRNEHTKRIMSSIYQFLQENLDESAQALKINPEVCFVIVEDVLVHPEYVCIQPLGKSCAPYLYELPADLRKFEALFSRLGVRNTFTAMNFASALEAMKAKHEDRVLDEEEVTVAVNMAYLLFKQLQPNNWVDFERNIYLPDTHRILQKASDLSCNNSHWLSEDGTDDKKFSVHAMIPYDVARGLGVKSILESTLEQHHLGEPFGQKEELVNRISRIMTAYPRDKEIFFELLQNADDSGATEIQFIKDCRNHPTEKVFGDSWKPLQGPALCVFNNKPFTKSDLKGIQLLGMGSKSDDPNKTGQYGVGFSSVYHLTDVPSFLTTIEEDKEQVLCVLDPHCLYIPGATSDKPGRQYTGLEQLKEKFPDAFSCFLENLFPLNEGTLFRFPLRTEAMAKDSKLCSDALSMEGLDELMKTFEKEMFEVLLFVNNLTQIKLSEVSADGSSIKTTYSVKATLSVEDALERKEFYAYVRHCRDALKAHKVTLKDIKVRQVCYSVVLEDSTNRKETWRVVQRIGFEDDVVIDESIERVFNSNDLCLMPRGGVAGIIKPAPRIHQPRRQRRVFCFLPLPVMTDLPVNVNGHFALDYESRRGLWLDDEGGGSRTKWNLTLLHEVVAQSYVTFLEDLRDQIQEDFPKTTSRERIENALLAYYMQFPTVTNNQNTKTWRHLSILLYKKIDADQVQLLPLVKQVYRDKRKTKDAEVLWLSTSKYGGPTATFFDYPMDDQKKHFQDLLVRAGIHWVYDPYNVCQHFEASSVKVFRLTPKDVINFLRHCQHPTPLPCTLDETIFGCENDLILVTNYCLKDEFEFWSNAIDLPLGLSQANNLHILQIKKPLFSSDYHDLLPVCADDFLHDSIRCRIGKVPILVIEKSPAYQPGRPAKEIKPPAVFKNFSLSDLKKRIPSVLDEQFICKDGAPVPWVHDSILPPNTLWLSRIWKYLAEQLEAYDTGNNTFDSKLSELIHQIEVHLSEVALIPAIKETKISFYRHTTSKTAEYERKRYLVSIRERKTVLDCNSVSKNGKEFRPVKEALQALAVLKLDETVFYQDQTNGTHNSYKELSFVKEMITNLNDPAGVLESVHAALLFMAENREKFANKEYCRCLLKYFSTELLSQDRTIFETLQRKLRLLPFYETQKGDLTALGTKELAILAENIPHYDFDQWCGDSRVLFLKKDCMPKKLADFLKCRWLDMYNVYCAFILPNFANLSTKGREVHLEYLRDKCLQFTTDGELNEDPAKLLDALHQLAFLDRGDGILSKACTFYDPENKLLVELWNPNRFPPAPFDSSEWLEFLRCIGLQTKPTNDDFVDLANKIACRWKSLGMEKVEDLAKMLISQMFRSETLDETLMQNIRQIPFICASHVENSFMEFYTPSANGSSESPLIKFDGSVSCKNQINTYCAWTTANLLPEWADPLWMDHNQLKCKREQVQTCRNTIVNQLCILEAPSEAHIAEHLNNLILATRESTKLQKGTLDDVFQKIYTELQRRAPLVMEETFRNMACILLRDTDENATFVKASQLVLSIQHQHQVHSYLVKTPPSLTEFSKLLIHLGAAEESSVALYSQLLEQLHVKYNNREMTPHDLTASHEAVRGLIAHLRSRDEASNLKTLYLPSTNGCLYASKELVDNDYPAFHERLASSSFDEPYLVDLQTLEVDRVDFDDAMHKIPQDLKPQSLCKILEERLHDLVLDFETEATSGPSEKLQKLLQSTAFHDALWRLIMHAHNDGKSKPDDEVRRKIEKALQRIEVRASEKLLTYLEHSGQKMEGSDAETDCFCSKAEIGTDDEHYIIYTRTSNELNMKTVIRVAEIIHMLSDGLLRSSVLYLSPLLQCQPHTIEPLLDELRITKRGTGTGRLPDQATE